jgi:hypothetical protein
VRTRPGDGGDDFQRLRADYAQGLCSPVGNPDLLAVRRHRDPFRPGAGRNDRGRPDFLEPDGRQGGTIADAEAWARAFDFAKILGVIDAR